MNVGLKTGGFGWPQKLAQDHKYFIYNRGNLMTDKAKAWVSRCSLGLNITGFFNHLVQNDDELAAVSGHKRSL